eukprot:g4607.t1 g4607   contig15:1383474-1384615(+)
MIHTPNLLLLAVFFLVASSHTSHLTSAFSIPPAIRPITTSCHPSSPLYTTRTVSESTDCVIDDSGTSDKQVEINPDKAAVIFLHGLGDSPDGWSKLTEALPNLRPNLAMLDITYVFPPASMVGITVNGGEQMSGWFDVYDWPIGLDAKDDPKGLAMSVKRVDQIVTQLKDEEGIDPSRVIVGGFAQGGAVALMAAYNRRKKDAKPFAGCMCLSGWLPMKDYLDVSEETAKATPLYWAHGQYDEKILFEQQVHGVQKLKGVGVDVSAYAFPVGHESANYEEIEAMAEFIDGILTSKTDQSKTKAVKYAYDEPESSEYDDETNALLYYLCAFGMEEAMQVEEEAASTVMSP